MGWFYVPKNKRKAMWMAPYYNKNLDVFMISYIISYYTKAGDFLGVVGMDIDFNKIVQLTNNVNIYKSGKIDLIDPSTYLIFRSNSMNSAQQDNLSLALYNHITTIDSKEKILVMQSEAGKKMLTCIGKLRNGMRIMLHVPVKEVNKQRNNNDSAEVLLYLL